MTAQIRTILYAAATGALLILTILGVITEAESNLIMEAVTAVVALAGAVLLIVASRHVDADSWSSLRQAIYVAVAACLAALAAFGIFAPDTLLPVLDVVLQTAGTVVLALAGVMVSPPDYQPERSLDQ